MIGIIFAMPEEFELILPHLRDIQETKLHHCRVMQAYVQHVPVCLIQAGIGKTNAAIATALLINKYNPAMIINVGIAGSVNEKIKTGDVVVSCRTVYYDVDVTVFGYQHGQVPRMPTHYESSLIHIPAFANHFNIHSGTVCTGDVFLTSRERLNDVKKHFDDISIVEMEAAAIAQACYHFNTTFLLIKGVTDQVDSAATEDSENNVKLAMTHAVDVLLQFLAQQ